MALDLNLWAQINLIGHVSYESYLNMTKEEAEACFHALSNAVEQAKANQVNMAGWESHLSKYGG